MAFSIRDLPSMAGRTAIVTGANSGLGYEVALELARHGASVTLACRNAASADAAAAAIRAATPGASVDVRELDLASLNAVARFAASWDEPLHLLINNAGVMAPPAWRGTVDGFELQFGTNHLGHFALTGRLLPHLRAAGSSRVVSVASLAHRTGTAAVLLGNPEADYQPMRAYSNSKLANLLFAVELQRRAVDGLTSTAAHPGVSATNLFLSPDGMGGNPLLRIGGRAVSRLVLQSARAGAEPILFAATLAEPGSYSGPRWFSEFRGPAVAARLSATALDDGLARQLWDLSEELTGVRFDWAISQPAG
jgi:NAD(P)-dependent dehydrogenase (short-subunit alcohol dehydrogenase family)